MAAVIVYRVKVVEKLMQTHLEEFWEYIEDSRHKTISLAEAYCVEKNIQLPQSEIDLASARVTEAIDDISNYHRLRYFVGLPGDHKLKQSLQPYNVTNFIIAR